MVAASLYLLIGKEEFLKKEFVRNFKGSFFKNPSERDLNFQAFDADSGGVAAFKDFLQTSPFLSPKRLAVLSGIDEFKEEERENLLSFLRSFSSSAAAVLVSDETSVKKSAFLSSLSQLAKTVPCHAPFDRELPQWVLARAKGVGIHLEPAARLLLIEKMGKDLSALSSSLEMLATYIHPRKDATAGDIEALLGCSLQNDVFLLVDVLLRKDAKPALSMVAQFLREGIRGFEIVAVLAGQFERLRRAKALMEEGVPGTQVGSELKVHSFFLDKFIAQVKTLSRLDLGKVFRELVSCDESIKTGALNEALAVERLVLSLCLQ